MAAGRTIAVSTLFNYRVRFAAVTAKNLNKSVFFKSFIQRKALLEIYICLEINK